MHLKVTLFHGCFSRFLNYTDGTKSRKASNMLIRNGKISNIFPVFSIRYQALER